MIVSIRQSLDKMAENLADQNKLISELKDSNGQLNDTNNELMQKKSDLKEKCRNSRPELQKEIVYFKNENAHLEETLEQLRRSKINLKDHICKKSKSSKWLKRSKLLS